MPIQKRVKVYRKSNSKVGGSYFGHKRLIMITVVFVIKNTQFRRAYTIEIDH